MDSTSRPAHREDTPASASWLEGLGLLRGDRVLVLGGYGTQNLGDEAILAGLLSQLPSDLRVRVVSRAPQQTAALHQVEAVSPSGAPAALFGSDALIVGGGGIFSGHMGLMGRLIPLFSLLARARRVRVAFHGVGVYATTPWWVQRALVWLAPHVASFTVRDRASARVLQSWGLAAQVVPDLSAMMTPAPPQRGAELLRSAGLKTDQPIVGLCLTATERRLKAPLMDAVPQLIDSLPEAQFCFVPMSQHPTVPHHNDLLLARQLQARAQRLTVLEGWHHPADVMALFGHFTVAVCMRYHSLLFAGCNGIPIVPIPYAEKCADWVQEHGIVPAELTTESLVERVSQALAQARGVGCGERRR